MPTDQRPANLLYSVDETPPSGLNLLLSLQHAALGLMYMVYPVILMQESGAGPEQTRSLISASLIAIGLATLLQTLKRGPVGSGYLAVQVTNPIFLPLSLQAMRIGGLGLVWGMTFVSGLFQALFSRAFSRFKTIFPPEVCGVVIAMLGISMVRISVTRFTGIDEPGGVVNPSNILVASLTLGVMFGITIWFRGRLRLFSLIIGFLFGFLVSMALGLVNHSQFASIRDIPLFAFPRLHPFHLNFDWTLFFPFVITGLVSSIDTAGGIITCQKFNNASWKRADMHSVSRGILADGLGNAVSGALGGFGVGVSSANLGLCMATGATSRGIGVLTGILFLIIGFLPRISFFLAVIPIPVIGAVLVYVSSFLIVSGMQLIMSRMLDDRRIAMVGLSFVAGLSVEIVPYLYDRLPEWTMPFFSSSLAVAAVTAILLNALFRLGISQKASLQIHPGPDSVDRLHRFMEEEGAGWGARGDVIRMANSALVEIIETVRLRAQTPMNITATFDEYNLDITVSYQGEPLVLSRERPDLEDLLEDEKALARLSGYLILQYADRVDVSPEGVGWRIRLHFEH
jgi:xanthine permease XanP